MESIGISKCLVIFFGIQDVSHRIGFHVIEFVSINLGHLFKIFLKPMRIVVGRWMEDAREEAKNLNVGDQVEVLRMVQ